MSQTRDRGRRRRRTGSRPVSASPPVTTTATELNASSTSITIVTPTADRERLPHRAALVDVVDRVRGAHERGHVARCRPDRDHEADDEQHAGGPAAVLEVLDRAREDFAGRSGDELVELVDQRLRRGGADQPEDRHERDQRREDREDPVVGERRREIGEVVLSKLGDRALHHAAPRAAVQAGRRARRARRALRPATASARCSDAAAVAASCVSASAAVPRVPVPIVLLSAGADRDAPDEEADRERPAHRQRQRVAPRPSMPCAPPEVARVGRELPRLTRRTRPSWR